MTPAWLTVLTELQAQPLGARVTRLRGDIEAPALAGAIASTGLPSPGKLADWRFPPTASCMGLHVHEHADRWVAHLDRVHPECSGAEHLRVDAPAIFVTLSSAVGGAVGFVARGALGSAVGTLVGALLGGLLVLPGRTRE
jgi:hypothetical protein